MCFKPILSPTAISHQWHLHAECALHLFEHNFLHLLFLFGINTEVEFVVHLQYHLRANAFELESVVDIDHRHLDDVGGSALDRCIDGISLGKSTYGGITRINVLEVSFALEQCFHIFLLSRCLLGFFHIFLHLN